jgi:hypothetical protein
MSISVLFTTLYGCFQEIENCTYDKVLLFKGKSVKIIYTLNEDFFQEPFSEKKTISRLRG